MSVIFKHQSTYELSSLKTNINEMVVRLGGWDHFFSKSDRVLLKPNLVAKSARENNALTDPAILESVIQILLDHKISNLKVGDSPAIESVKGVAMSNGIWDVCKKYQVPLIPLKGSIPSNISGRKWAISQEVLSSDKVINLPKWKGHKQLYYTGAVKNLFGCVSGKKKFFYHMKLGDTEGVFAQMLLDIVKLVAPTINLMDGIGVQSGNGPINGVPTNMGLLAISKCPVEMDMAILNWLKADLEESQVARYLIKRGNNSIFEDRVVWLDKKFQNESFYFAKDRSPIRFSLMHTFKSLFKSLRRKVLFKA